VATYQNISDKITTLTTALKKIDILKFFLQVAWELKAIDNKKYIEISEKALELGRMVGGWRKDMETKLPTIKSVGRT